MSDQGSRRESGMLKDPWASYNAWDLCSEQSICGSFYLTLLFGVFYPSNSKEWRERVFAIILKVISRKMISLLLSIPLSSHLFLGSLSAQVS